MEKSGKVLLITGPAGSGKSTLAANMAEGLGWQYISEDDYWVKNDWGHGLRTEEQEAIVQEQVLNDLLLICAQGSNVVLEFILYKTPPNPLTAYTETLKKNSIAYDVIALKPTINEIMKRLTLRGRKSDLQNTESRRRDAENQLRCLLPEYLPEETIIESSNLSVDELCRKYTEVNRL